jgi:hypothetical protein
MPISFFRIEMLPARYGDCLWVEYGSGRDFYRLMIDGGPVSTYEFIKKRLEMIPANKRAFELMVLSHVDADHIEGMVRLFAEKPLPFAVEQVWFNGWRQMNQAHGLLGPMQGEFLSALLLQRVPRAWRARAEPWAIPAKGQLPSFTLGGGMKLTLLSPNRTKLEKMVKAWQSVIKEYGIRPGDLDAAWRALAEKKKFLPKKGLLGDTPNLDALVKSQFMKDQAIPNGSSIAFLAEYAGKSALFLADAHPDLIADSIQRLCAERQTDRLPVNAVKVAHHGSKNNTSVALLKLIKSPWYLISTNGDQFKHPDQQCMARIIEFGKPERLYFNYKSTFTQPWLTAAAEKKYHYRAIVRGDNELSLTVAL